MEARSRGEPWMPRALAHRRQQGNRFRDRKDDSQLTRLIRSTGAHGVVVLSGDRHIGAIYREANPLLPYPLYELTSSGITHP